MPLDPFSLIAHYESSDNPIAQNPKSTASGLFGDLNSTWGAALNGIGLSTSQYPNAASAPPSVQFAANAYLINQHGLSDWTCGNCDAALTAALQANGGTSAYQLTGLSTDPATYASLDTPSNLQNYFSSNGSNFSTAGGTADPLSTTAPGALVSTYTWLWNEITTKVEQPVQQGIQGVESWIAGFESVVLLIAVGLFAIRFMWGRA